MAYHYKLARKFYDEVKKLCKANAYNLVLHKHLGDIFYAIAAKEEFEATYNSKLRFIIRPSHEFLMQMWGIEDYGVYDLDSLVIKNNEFKSNYFNNHVADAQVIDRLENEMFQALFSCLPIKGEPFVCESLINNFFLYPRFWAYRWATNMGIEEDFRFVIPKHMPEFLDDAKKKLKKIAPLDKIVLFAPDASTAKEFPSDFWNIIAERVHAHGYKIIVNSKKYKINHGISAFDLGFSLSDIVALGLSCAYVFSLRSGLCDVLVGAREKLYAIYPAILHREMNSLNKCFEPMPNINEIAVWRWKIDEVIWEGENLTKPLQKHINLLHRAYIKELIKTVLYFPFCYKREGHKFYYRLFRDLAGKSNVFPENNIENKHHKYRERKFSFLGLLPIYERKYKQEKHGKFTINHLFLGGLLRIKLGRKFYRVSFLGVSVFVHKKGSYKLCGITVKKYNASEQWILELQKQIDKKYDDIYFLRHNIGETYVELMHLKDRIKVNNSKKPLLIVWDKKYLEFYKMFLPKSMDFQYINLDQSEIHSVFEKDTTIKLGKQRFLCSTPFIAQNMKKLMKSNPDINFYNYINESVGIKKATKPVLPEPSVEAIHKVEAKIKRIELKKKFVILAPEANSLVRIKKDFWEKLASRLRKKGYDVFLNVYDQNVWIKDTKNAKLTIEEMFIFAQKSRGIITLGSGLAVFLTSAKVPMDIIYTDFDSKIGYDSTLVMQVYSVFHLQDVSSESVKEHNFNLIKEQELIENILNRY